MTANNEGKFRRWLLLGAALWLACAASGTTIVPPDFVQLVASADYVVRAKVMSVTAEPRTVDGRALIFTKIEIEVLDVIAGTPPARPVLVMLGGKIGAEELWIEGAPRFAVGDEDILFVQGNGTNLHPLVGFAHGRYPIRRDAAGREFVARANGAPLAAVAEVSRPVTDEAAGEPNVRSPATAVSPATFTAAIRQTRNNAIREK